MELQLSDIIKFEGPGNILAHFKITLKIFSIVYSTKTIFKYIHYKLLSLIKSCSFIQSSG